MKESNEIKKDLRELVMRLVLKTMKKNGVSLAEAKKRVYKYLENEEPGLLNVMVS